MFFQSFHQVLSQRSNFLFWWDLFQTMNCRYCCFRHCQLREETKNKVNIWFSWRDESITAGISCNSSIYSEVLGRQMFVISHEKQYFLSLPGNVHDPCTFQTRILKWMAKMVEKEILSINLCHSSSMCWRKNKYTESLNIIMVRVISHCRSTLTTSVSHALWMSWSYLNACEGVYSSKYWTACCTNPLSIMIFFNWLPFSSFW